MENPKLVDTSVQMSYGFDSPRKPRPTEKPNHDLYLYDKFFEWLQKADKYLEHEREWEKDCDSGYELYKMALDIVNDSGLAKFVTPEEVHTMVANCSHRYISAAGAFLSAIYNLIDEEEIVFDIEPLENHQKLHFVGIELPENKRLILKSDTGNGVGHYSNGTIVNYGDSGHHFCKNAKGRCVNYGAIEDVGDTNFDADGSFDIINYGLIDVVHATSAHNMVIVNFGEIFGDFAVGDSEGCFDANNYQVARMDVKAINCNDVNGNMSENLAGSSFNFSRLGGSMGNPDGVWGVAVNGGKAIVWEGGNVSEREEQEETHDGRVLRTRQIGYYQRLNREIGIAENPQLQEYLSRLKNELEKYRGAKFPQCLEVVDLIRKEIVSPSAFRQYVVNLTDKSKPVEREIILNESDWEQPECED